MPYIKPKEIPHEKMRRLIIGYDLTPVKLAYILDCSAPTAREKLNNPERFTLGDLKKINQKGHIPLEEIREGLKW